MKSFSFFLSLTMLLFLTACDGDDAGHDLELLREARKELIDKKKELSGELGDIQHQIDSLEKEIIKLDPEYGKEKAVAVVADTVKKGPFRSYIELHGVVESGSNVLIVPEISGTIRKIAVKSGQTVKKGQVLAQIDTDVLQKNLQELKTSLELAEELYQKQDRLRQQNIGSEVQYLEAKNRKESLEQSIQTVAVQISKGTIRSPIDGKVEEVIPREGEMASPQMPFARVVNTTRGAYVEAEVSEAFYRRINLNDSVWVTFKFIDEQIKAPITYKSDFIDPGNRTFKIHVTLPANKKGYPPNLLGVVRLEIDSQEEVISVPTHLIQLDEKVPYVFAVQEQKGGLVAVKTPVKRGQMSGNRTVITKGIKEGDVIITKAIMTNLKGKGQAVPVAVK